MMRGALAWLRPVLLASLLVLLALLVWWAWPKSRVLPVHPTYVAYYRGFGMPGSGDNPLLGRSHYRVRITDVDGVGYTDVWIRRSEFCEFEGYYVNGQLREKGRCRVEWMDGLGYPCPDLHDVQRGRYYKPDGELGSEVAAGTGVQTYWNLSGAKTWELELRDFQRKRHAFYYPNGQFMETMKYQSGQVHGPFVSFHPNGKKKLAGSYCRGERVGRWTYYNEGGSVEKTEDYGRGSKD